MDLFNNYMILEAAAEAAAEKTIETIAEVTGNENIDAGVLEEITGAAQLSKSDFVTASISLFSS